ncbi:hypothetical protein NUKP65_32290 [Klebsiella variicola]|jgi:hypothetical protein|nr:hypothetical protein NUKP65_32290 [Klebsiella variicola]GKM80459.1 hypothetical protein NUKP68_33950 [Klebsiella variicola]VAS33254.1 transposase [Klebsiella variicola]
MIWRLSVLTVNPPAAISLWNTVYMERAVDALKRKGVKINEQLLSHLSPLGWEHINLKGDYIWKSNRIPASGKFRRLRSAKVERSKNNLNVQ